MFYALKVRPVLVEKALHILNILCRPNKNKLGDKRLRSSANLTNSQPCLAYSSDNTICLYPAEKLLGILIFALYILPSARADTKGWALWWIYAKAIVTTIYKFAAPNDFILCNISGGGGGEKAELGEFLNVRHIVLCSIYFF